MNSLVLVDVILFIATSCKYHLLLARYVIGPVFHKNGQLRASDPRPDLEEPHSRQSHMYHVPADLHQKKDRSMQVFLHM